MTRLTIAPHEAAAEKWSREARDRDAETVIVSPQQLVRRVLRDCGTPYREHQALELLAAWEAVAMAANSLRNLHSVSRFPGFVEDMRDLFDALGSEESLLGRLPEQNKREILGLFQSYRAWTAERHVMDRAERMCTAADRWMSSSFRMVQSVERWYLPEPSPLEERFWDVVGQGRAVHSHTLTTHSQRFAAAVLPDPRAEVEWICRQISMELRDGVRPASIAVALPSPALYGPLFFRALKHWQIPFEPPPQTLLDVPVGRAFCSLFAGACLGWRKSDLRLLTAPGWGFPFSLDASARRTLRLAPPVKGLVRQREYLGGQPQWAAALNQLAEWSSRVKAQPLSAYGELLRDIMQAYPRELWAAADPEQWALLASAWSGLERLSEWLADTQSTAEPHQFASLLKLLMSRYPLPNPRILREGVSLIRPDEAVGMNYSLLFVPGLVDGAVPSPCRPHWLTQQAPEPDSDVLRQLAAACDRLKLSYPETDLDGKPNLPSALLDQAHNVAYEEGRRPVKRHDPQPFTQLTDPAVLARAAERVLESGMSASRLNVYTRCPYQYFCRYVLELEADEVLDDEVSPLDEGSLAHKTLFLFWQRGGEGDGGELAETVFAEAGKPLSPGLKNSLRMFCRKDKELTQGRGLQPQWLEKAFSGPAIATRFGVVQFRGVLDRIDTTSSGDYVLYDYKIGGSPTVAAVRKGLELQLPVYVLAAAETFPGDVLGAVFYGLRDGKQTGLWRREAATDMGVRRAKNCLTEDQWLSELEAYRGFLRGYLEGILSGEFPIKPREPRICTYCPYANMCRREVYR